jgi:hypothetical protein
LAGLLVLKDTYERVHAPRIETNKPAIDVTLPQYLYTYVVCRLNICRQPFVPDHGTIPRFEMSLLNLSPELLLLISSNLRQVQLLNLLLVCKRLHAAVEPELYREYNNSLLHCRPLLPFIRKLLERPLLQNYVRQINLFAWSTLETLGLGIDESREHDDVERLALLGKSIHTSR